MLFRSDHIMGWSTTVITPPDGDMTDYLASLDRIRARNFTTLWPTHGPPIRDVDAFIGAYIAHRQERVDQILGALKAGPGSIKDLVPRLYADVDPKLWPAAARSMEAAMIHLERLGQIAAEGTEGAYRLAPSANTSTPSSRAASNIARSRVTSGRRSRAASSR